MERKTSVLFVLRGAVFIVAFILYILNLFFPNGTLTMMVNVTSILLFFTAIIGVARFYFIMAIVFLLSSVILAITRDVSWSEMMSGFSTMVKLILFIGVIPLISSPIQNYIRTIQKMIQALNHRVSSFQVCQSTTFILGNIINMAAIPISKTMFFQDGTEVEKRVKSELSLRAFGLAMMCSPIGAALALAIDLTNTSWLSLLAINLILVVIGLFLSYYLTKRHRLLEEQKTLSEKVLMEKADFVNLAAVFGPFFLYFLLLIYSERFASIGMMETILISVLPFTFLWSLFLKKVNQWWGACRLQVFQQTPKFFGQFAVIISAGLLTHTIEVTGLNQALTSLLPGTTGSSDFGAFYIPITILLVFILSVFGVHQFVAMIFTSQIIIPETFGINPIVFASALLVGFASGMLGSAFSGATITMSGLLHETSYKVAQKNYLFVFIFIGISSFLLILINFYLTAR